MLENRLWPVSIKGVLFIDKKVVLLLNDRDEWELPGARLEKGETPEACLQRELNENSAAQSRLENFSWQKFSKLFRENSF
jgi:ADP-ribose pyrophosphatase YjhB (NUDIX family)